MSYFFHRMLLSKKEKYWSYQWHCSPCYFVCRDYSWNIPIHNKSYMRIWFSFAVASKKKLWIYIYIYIYPVWHWYWSFKKLDLHNVSHKGQQKKSCYFSPCITSYYSSCTWKRKKSVRLSVPYSIRLRLTLQ